MEYLWAFSKRKDNYSLFSYKNKDGIKTFDKRFIPRQKYLSTDYIEYQEMEDIKYIDTKIKLEDILIGTYVQLGYEPFLIELDKYISELFFRYDLRENSNYLKGETWDYLPRNTFFDNNNYIFFDVEAKYKSPIRKSQCLANVILDFNEKFYFDDNKKYEIYKYFTNKYSLEDVWEWCKNQRINEINEILFYPANSSTCYDGIENILQIKGESIIENKNLEKGLIDSSMNFLEKVTTINNNLSDTQKGIILSLYLITVI